MSFVGKLLEPYDTDNMATFVSSHFKNYTHTPTNETRKTGDGVTAPQTTNLFNNGGSKLMKWGEFKKIMRRIILKFLISLYPIMPT